MRRGSTIPHRQTTRRRPRNTTFGAVDRVSNGSCHHQRQDLQRKLSPSTTGSPTEVVTISDGTGSGRGIATKERIGTSGEHNPSQLERSSAGITGRRTRRGRQQQARTRKKSTSRQPAIASNDGREWQRRTTESAKISIDGTRSTYSEGKSLLVVVVNL